jgi:ABC-type polysaccharide/polyol phosphate export permease
MLQVGGQGLADIESLDQGPQRPGLLQAAGQGLADISQGLANWRIWWMFAWNDVRRRYRRSGLGQFWLTLSMAATIGGLGFVYSSLFHTDVTKYLPYISVTFVGWGIISTLVIDSCTAFTENENLLRHVYLPRSLLVFRVMGRTFVVAAHNILIIPIVFAIFHVGVNANILWLAAGLPLVIVNGFWFGFFLAIVCARFRDVPQIVTSIMQVVFFITPVMFLPEQLSQRGISVLRWSPFASLLEVLSAPVLGSRPSDLALVMCATMAAIGFLLVLPFAGRYAPRAVYWL